MNSATPNCSRVSTIASGDMLQGKAGIASLVATGPTSDIKQLSCPVADVNLEVFAFDATTWYSL